MKDKSQANYYDRVAQGRRPADPPLIGAARRLNLRMRALIDADQTIRDTQLRWMGDLSSCSVLEIGCFTGNALTLGIAAQCKQYRGIDISPEAIATLSSKLETAGLDHAEAITGDILSADLGGPWDVIYAHGVLHHFANLDPILKRLAASLNSDGVLITFDPMQTSWPIRSVRRLFRPFQSDADWEFPFDRLSFETIQKHFSIIGVQGVLGYAKWAAPLLLLPGDTHFARERITYWHERDKQLATSLGPNLWRCMSSTLCCVRH